MYEPIIESVFDYNGFKCIVKLFPNPCKGSVQHGYRCGYIVLPPDHPWYKKAYDDIIVVVHGGLTFDGSIKIIDPSQHTEEWCIGFDCCHAGDTSDPCDSSLHHWTHNEVVEECKFLVDQAIKAAKESKGILAAKKFLKTLGNKVIDTIDDWVVFKDKDDGCIAFAKVEMTSNGFSEFKDSSELRKEFEVISCQWCFDHPDITDVMVRCDLITLNVLCSDRAMLRHVVNVLRS